MQEELQSFLDKVEGCLEEHRYAIDDLPEFADYTSLIEGRGFQEELTKWSKVLSEKTKRYTTLKLELQELNEVLQLDLSDLPASQKQGVETKLRLCKDGYEDLIDIARNHVNTVKKLIESTRSLQSHSNPSV